jgi:hypothetical protein
MIFYISTANKIIFVHSKKKQADGSADGPVSES